MRLGPFEIRRAPSGTVEAATAAKAPGELGASGTIVQDGFLTTEEHQPDLRGHQGLRVYRQMRRSDASVREAEQHIFAPIKNATYDVQPYSDEPDDLAAAAAVRAAYFKWLSRPWLQHLQQALTHLSYGHMLFEPVMKVVEDELTYDHPETGEQQTVPARQYLTWDFFGQRLPWTIWKWNIDGGHLESVTQNAIKDDRYETELVIPADRLLVFVNEQEGDDYTGQSILRTAHWAWKLKQLVERVAAVSVERHGVGTWVAYPPMGDADNQAMLERLEQIFTGLGLGDAKYVVAPFPKQQAGSEAGGMLELISPSGGLPDFVPLLEYLRGEIKGNVLARFAELGHGRTGARSTGDTQSEVWYDALHAVATYICEVHNQQAIPRFMQANFGHDRYPQLVVQDIESRSFEEFAKGWAQLSTSGLVVADTSIREFIRRAWGAPDEDETEQPPEIEAEQTDDDSQPEPGGDGEPANADGEPVGGPAKT